MVLLMSRLGLLTEDDTASITTASVSAASVLEILGNVWMRNLADSYDFEILSASATLIFPNRADIGYYEDLDPEKMYAAVVFNAFTPEWIAGGAVFEALEARCPGLGRTTIHHIDAVLYHFGLPHTINGVLDMCRHLDWMGEDDETAVLEELGDEAEDADVVRFADVVAGIPEWAYSQESCSSILPPKKLQQQMKKLKNDPLGKIVAAIVRLDQLHHEMPLFTDMGEANCDYEPCEPPVVIGWHTPNDFDQYLDNYQNYYMQGESPSWVGGIRFEIAEEGISEAVGHVLHTGRILKALDDALVLIRDYTA